jgi:hypothetical protein
MAATATKSGIADCDKLAGEITEVLAGVLAVDGALLCIHHLCHIIILEPRSKSFKCDSHSRDGPCHLVISQMTTQLNLLKISTRCQ